VFVYPTPRRAGEAVREVIDFLELDAAAVRRHGRAVVALLGGADSGAAEILGRCADRTAGN
jgi:hypothetical protein